MKIGAIINVMYSLHPSAECSSYCLPALLPNLTTEAFSKSGEEHCDRHYYANIKDRDDESPCLTTPCSDALVIMSFLNDSTNRPFGIEFTH